MPSVIVTLMNQNQIKSLTCAKQNKEVRIQSAKAIKECEGTTTKHRDIAKHNRGISLDIWISQRCTAIWLTGQPAGFLLAGSQLAALR